MHSKLFLCRKAFVTVLTVIRENSQVSLYVHVQPLFSMESLITDFTGEGFLCFMYLTVFSQVIELFKQFSTGVAFKATGRALGCVDLSVFIQG